ncbi:MAG: response regulator [Deltaproteobacteria bacterium]|nr:response regulator [Deltaproteobacteria bacterium]
MAETIKVLAVDDDQDFLDAFAERMQIHGLSVTKATSGIEALSKAEEQTFDAVILDMAMPQMDGIDTLKRLRKINPDLQVILLTGHATIDKSVEAIKLGAIDFLEKPAEIDAVMDRIKAAKFARMLLVEKKTEERIKKIISDKGW